MYVCGGHAVPKLWFFKVLWKCRIEWTIIQNKKKKGKERNGYADRTGADGASLGGKIRKF